MLAAAAYEQWLMFVNPTCPKALDSLVAAAGQDAGLVRSLAAKAPAKFPLHHGWQQPNHYALAEEARIHLEVLECEAILELQRRPSGPCEVRQHWAGRRQCAHCINPYLQLAKCWGCDRFVCKACVTEAGICCDEEFCQLQVSPWRAAIRVLQKSDHPIFQKWLQEALLANACREHIGWGPEPRYNAKAISYTCHNKP
jgi:hypothetical protein